MLLFVLHDGYQELCLFTLLLLWRHFTGSSTSSIAWFSVTWWESTPVVALSSMVLYLAEHLFITGAVPCHFAILYQVSHTLSCSFKVELEFCVYQDSTASLILTFSLLPILLEKLVSYCLIDWQQSKFAWDHIQIAYLAEFLHEIPCVRYSRLRDYFWS